MKEEVLRVFDKLGRAYIRSDKLLARRVADSPEEEAKYLAYAQKKVNRLRNELEEILTPKLPSFKDLEGIDLTNGVDPTEYVRRLRE